MKREAAEYTNQTVSTTNIDVLLTHYNCTCPGCLEIHGMVCTIGLRKLVGLMRHKQAYSRLNIVDTLAAE